MDLERRLNSFMSVNIQDEIDESKYNYSVSEINDILSDLYYKISDLSIDTTKLGFNRFLVKFKITNDDIEQIIADSRDFKVVFRELLAERTKNTITKYIEDDDDEDNENDDDNDDIKTTPINTQTANLTIKDLKEKNKIYIGKVAALSKKVKSLEAEVKILREQL